MTQQILWAAACSIGLICTAGAEAAPATVPATNQAAGVANGGVEAMVIHIVEVKGLVQVRTAEGKPWQKATVGMVLDQGAEFRTGPRSSVTCQIPPDQTLTLDRLGTMRIDEAIRTGTKIKTDMIMKYGRTKYDIEAAGAEHESTIRSPGSTLAVRGTFVSLYDQPPYAPVAESFHGQAEFRAAHRELRFGGKTPTVIASDKGSVVETALAKSTIDPTLAQSRTRSDQRYIADQTSKSATFSFDLTEGIPVIRDGPPPLTDAQLLASVPSLPGSLDIVLRWQGNADINLVVGDEAGTNPVSLLTNFHQTEFLYPGYGLNHGFSGGTIPYNNLGGPNGGMEIAYWKGDYPHGLYGISAIHESGGPALVTLDVFADGKQLTNLRTLEVDSTGNLYLDPNSGYPVLVKNSQITRPVDAPTKSLNSFGPDSGSTEVVAFIPPVPTYNGSGGFVPDNAVMQEPPISFPPPPTKKHGKSATTGAEATSGNTPVTGSAGIPKSPRSR